MNKQIFELFGFLSMLLFLMACDPTQGGTTPPPGFEIKDPAVAGNGCPAGTVKVAISDDKKKLLLELSDFKVVAGGPNGKSLARKSCNIAVPVEVPLGYKVAVVPNKFLLDLSLAEGAKASFKSEGFFPTVQGNKLEYTQLGEKEELIEVKNSTPAEELVFSGCGVQTNLRLNTSLLLRSKNEAQASHAEVVKIGDEESGALSLVWEKCK